MRVIAIFLGAMLLPLISLAQISGTITGIEGEEIKPLPGANVFWKGTETGAVTDTKGRYTIERIEGVNTLVVSFIGYQPQSQIIISKKGTINFTLIPAGSELDQVEVVGKVDATTVDLKRADLTYRIDDKELRKAACCNLSESFETNASVDVSFTDAVTGQRQIEMLGLAGKYALIQRENIPYARGLNANSGLTYIPGPSVEGLQLTKGLSSVMNGYESITGQINVDLYKPETGPLFFANAFVNQGARSEINILANAQNKERSYAGLMAHGSIVPFAQDRNDDGFADMPVRSQINLLPRWHWRSKDGHWEGQLGISYVGDQSEGGQMSFLEEGPDTNETNWGFTSDATRIEAFGKSGYMFEDPNRSIGIIYSIGKHTRTATFGDRSYDGSQNSAYLNTIYQGILGSTFHKFRTGVSVQADWTSEELYTGQRETYLYSNTRNEVVPGAYFEYTLEPGINFTLVSGVRADYNSYFDKLYVTPRLHLRYMPTEHTTLRIGGGRGQRTPNVINENLNILASSRSLDFSAVDTTLPETAWNSGFSVAQDVHIGNKKIGITADAFYTWFSNKLVTDLDVHATEASFIYTEGSRSLSVLGQIDYELFRNFDLRLAYKYLNSEEEFIAGLRQSYMVPKHRAFANFAYATADLWKFDLTLNWFGEKRLPDTEFSPVEFQRPQYSDAFFTVNSQINKEFKGGWEVYAGVENLLDFRQDDPIVNAADPFGDYFDSNFAWGPVFGRNIYLGVNYRLEQKD